MPCSPVIAESILLPSALLPVTTNSENFRPVEVFTRVAFLPSNACTADTSQPGGHDDVDTVGTTDMADMSLQ